MAANLGKQSSGCLIVFALVFVLAGCIPGGIAVHDLLLARQMESWQPTEARITSLDLTGRKSSHGIACTYVYLAPGPSGAIEMTEHHGTRVGLHGGSDNVGSWQLDTYRRLRVAFEAGRPVPCWYDPEAPDKAVLVPGIRWGLLGFLTIFPVVFGGFGLGMLLLVRHARRREERLAQLATADPGKPWLADPSGTAQIIPGETGALLWAPLLTALIWNAAAWPIAVVASHQATLPLAARLAIWTAPALGLVMAGWAVYAVARRLHHGVGELRLSRVPVALGDWTDATVVCSCDGSDDELILPELSCIRRVTTGSGKNTSTKEVREWSAMLAVARRDLARADDGRCAIPLRLPAPADCPPTSPDGTVFWRLDLRISRPGIDALHRFTLPVLPVGDSSGTLDRATATAALPVADLLTRLASGGLAVAQTASGFVVSLPAPRNPGLSLGGSIAAGLFAWGVVIAWVADVTLFLCLPLSLIAIASLRGALRSWLWRGSIAIDRATLTLDNGWWRSQHHEQPLSACDRIDLSTTLSSGDTAYYNAQLVLRSGQRIEIGRGLVEPAASTLRDLLSEAIKRG
jgi:hypothetical protein